MCGLVGVFSTLVSNKDADVFRCMLMLDIIRGEHSTGVLVGLTRHGHRGTILLKAPGFPSRLFDKYPQIFEEKGTLQSSFNDTSTTINLLLGHNRQATVGGLNLDNAHPFAVNGLVGAHNGTIKVGMHKLKEEETIGTTDSEAIYTKLARTGSLKETFEGLRGAAALTYWNKKTREMCFYRNSERTLWLCASKANTTMLWASEKWMIERSLARCKVEAQFNEPVLLDQDLHIKFAIQGNKIIETHSETVKLEKNSVVTHTPSNTTHKPYRPHTHARKPGPVSTNNFDPDTGLLGGKDYVPEFLSAKESAKTFADNLEEALNDSIPFGGKPQTGWLDVSNTTKDRLVESMKYGCQLCQADIDWDDYLLGGVQWLDIDTPLCSCCSEDFKYG